MSKQQSLITHWTVYVNKQLWQSLSSLMYVKFSLLAARCYIPMDYIDVNITEQLTNG